MKTPRRLRGRPVRPMLEYIPDTPENVMRAILATPPKKLGEWKYIQEYKDRTARKV